MVYWLSLLQNFIQLSLNSSFAQVQILVGTFDNGPGWNKAKRLSSVNHTTKTIHNHHHQGQLWVTDKEAASLIQFQI